MFEYLQSKNIIYRDLKPENVLIDEDGYLKLTDFGFAKFIDGRTYTLCGTPEYLAPEVITEKAYGFSVDWYSMGLVLFEMLSGYNPFKTGQEQTFVEQMNTILKTEIPMQSYFSPEAKDLLTKLLVKDVSVV